MEHEPLPIPEKGKKAWPLSAWWIGRVGRMFNALMKMEVRRGGGDSVTWSDGKLIITLKRIEDRAGTSSLTVQEVDASPTVTEVTKIVVPNDSLTDDGSGQVTLDFSSTSIQQAKIQSYTTTNDYASVKLATYNETTNVWDVSGSAFNAALPHLNRQAAKPGSPHADAVSVMWPQYAVDDIVLITAPEGGTGVEVSSVDLENMILPNKRAWCFEIPVCADGTTYYAIIPAWTMTTTSNGSFNPVD